MRVHHISRLLSVAALFLLSSVPVHAGAIWTVSAGKVNNFDVDGQITYTIFCQNGQIIRGSSGAQPGTRACNDGSNILTWSWGVTQGPGDPVPWTKAENEDNKSGAFRKVLRDSLQKLFDQGKLIVMGQVKLPQETGYAERAVLAVPRAVLAPHAGKTVDQLLADNVIPPQAVLFHRRYRDLPADLDVTEQDTVLAPGIIDLNQVCILEYVNSSVIAPGSSPAVVGAAFALILAAGVVMLRRRRSMQATG